MTLLGKSDDAIKAFVNESKRCADLYHGLIQDYDRGLTATAAVRKHRNGHDDVMCTISYDRVRVSLEKPKAKLGHKCGT